MSKYIVPLPAPKKVQEKKVTTIPTKQGNVQVTKVTPFYETNEGKRALQEIKKITKK